MTGTTIISELTGDRRSIVSSSSFSSSADGHQRQGKKWNNDCTSAISPNVVVDSFKGVNELLKEKACVMSGTQAAKYDKSYKALIVYFRSKYDQRIYRAFQ